jgi:hypothetical protein
MPGLARADDGVVDPLSSVTTLTDATPEAIADEALAVAEETAAAAEPLDSPDVAAVVADPAEVLEPQPDAAVPEAPASEPVVQPAPEPDPVADNATVADTTAVSDDIASDTPPPPAGSADSVEEPPAPAHETPVSEPPAGASDPPAQGTTAANINVSVRIGSPGDNGSVTQLNVAGDAPTAQAGNDTTHVPSPEESEHDTSSAAPTDTWYWRWDCLGAGSLGAISPIASTAGSIPTSWTWFWNCGDKSSQYQSESNSGYHQVNTNVEIRIASPGNDGSVTQVNVGAGIRFSSPTPPLPSLPVPAPQGWEPSLPALPLDLNDAGDALIPPTALPVPVIVGDIALPPPVSAPATTLPSETSSGTPLVPRPSGLERTWPTTAVPFGADARASWLTTPSGDDRPVQVSPVAAERELPGVASDSPRIGDAGRVASHPSPNIAVKKHPAPRWRPAPPQRSAPAPLSTASAAAAAGGGSPGSGLPFLLALPFVAALLDLARRVALEHATWPSGHRRRVPDRPG